MASLRHHLDPSAVRAAYDLARSVERGKRKRAVRVPITDKPSPAIFARQG